jgi:two-component system OmpR family sensor kinase
VQEPDPNDPSAVQGQYLVVAIPTADVDATLRRLLLVEVGVGVAVLSAFVALGTWAVRLGLRPLDRIAATAGAIAAGDLRRRVQPATPRTEVGRLGLALNAMLGQIERAFAARAASEERLRRFIADASHELRTPLSSIRGYAELFRRGAGGNPEDLATAMRRIEAESARMGHLVDDLLLLARLDEGRPLERSPIDLAVLAEDAVVDARAAAPRRAISLAAGDDVVVAGDELRLRQVVGNLVRNALVHTPPDTPVEVAVAADGQAVVLTVTDHGPGIPPGTAERIFERFYRADPGGGRDHGGSGLGLSIVAAVVTAHGGTAAARDTPGGGATFEVRLPLFAGGSGQESDEEGAGDRLAMRLA